VEGLASEQSQIAEVAGEGENKVSNVAGRRHGKKRATDE